MNKQDEIDDWAKKALCILKQYGYINNNHKLLIILTVVILGLSFLSLGYYAGTHEWFKSSINQTVNLDPEIDVNITNHYLFMLETDNEYINNFTIVNKIDIPENLCG